MLAKPLFLLSLLMAAAGLLEAASWCGPSCVGASAGDKVKVPWDCTKYSVCADIHGNNELWPSDPTSCPDEQYFDDTGATPECADIDGANAGFCVNSCSPCDLLWSSIGDTTPDPDACGTFYVGVAGQQLIASHCEGGFPFYDYVGGGCSADASVCFGFCDHCEPYCIGNGNIADPMDCTYFYLCAPPEMAHVRCPVGESFDVLTGSCAAVAVCGTC